MKLYIPTIGSHMVLTRDWTFDVYDEHRNKGLLQFKKCNFTNFNGYGREVARKATLSFPIGTELCIERIYIRRNNSEFDSLTFTVQKTDLELHQDVKKFKKIRFWAKLSDCNQMECVVV